MEPGASTLLSQGVSNNPYPEPNQPNALHWHISLISIVTLFTPADQVYKIQLLIHLLQYNISLRKPRLQNSLIKLNNAIGVAFLSRNGEKLTHASHEVVELQLFTITQAVLHCASLCGFPAKQVWKNSKQDVPSILKNIMFLHRREDFS